MTEEQLEQLWRAERTTVYRFVRRRTASHEQAEDVVGDVFLAACKACHRDDGSELSVGWLMTVARRRLIDDRRRSIRYQALAVRVDHQHQDRRVDEWEGDAGDGKLAMTAALTALAELPPRQAEVVRLRCLLDLPAAAVATHMGTSPGAVDCLLARARRNLCAGGLG